MLIKESLIFNKYTVLLNNATLLNKFRSVALFNTVLFNLNLNKV